MMSGKAEFGSVALGALLVAVLLGGLATAGSAKEGRTYYTAERIQAAQDNIATYEWAQKKYDEIMNAPPLEQGYGNVGGESFVGATRQVQLSDEQIFAMMPPISIPRDWFDFKATNTCPKHGTDIKRTDGYYPWRVDFANHPYKLICPVGGEMYPSNDFAAGELAGGDYPDDGNGCVMAGETYQFIRYWVHLCYLCWVRPTIDALAEAYLLTGDVRYGHKAAVLLAAVANQYPGPSYHSNECHNGAYGKKSGAITYHTWECLTIPRLALAYDAIWPVYEQSPELLEFLQSKGLPAQTAAEAREFVEERLLRQAMQGLLDGALQGNPGHHQQAAAMLALVMDDHSSRHPNSHDMMHYAYYEGYAPTRWVMTNFLTRDGGGFEGPGYDKIKFDYVKVADLLEELRQRHPDQYPESEFPRVMEEPKARAMYDFFTRIVSLDYYLPEVGDSGGSWLSGRITTPKYLSMAAAQCVGGYLRYRDPQLARAALGVTDEMPLGQDLYTPPAEAQLRAAAALPEAQIKPGTRLLDDYGFAFLHSGEGQRRREAMINYSALKGHHQYDYLSLYLFANEIACLPDLGYPFTWDYRWQWDCNLYTHNSVVVDGAFPLHTHMVPQGWTSLLGDAGWAQAAVVAHQPYWPHPTIAPAQPPVSRYERVCVMVEEDEQDAYLLDLFVVDGGRRHDQSWHSTTHVPQLPPLEWAEQTTGTAAGPDVPFDGKYVNLRGEEVQDGLCYVTGVKRATLAAPATFHWEYSATDHTGLRLHLVPLGGPKELIFGGGRSPARPTNWSLPLLFVRSEQATEGLTTRFLTLLEPCRGDSTTRITGVTAEGQWPLKVRVERGEAVDEVTIYAPSKRGGLQRSGPRELGIEVRTVAGGQTVRAARFGQLPSQRDGVVRGRVIAVNRRANTVTLDQPLPAGARWLRLHSPGRSSMYEVAGQHQRGQRTLVKLRETGLLAQAIPAGYQRGIIKNDAPIPFASYPVSAEDHQPVYHDRFFGARVESADGRVSLRLRGVDGRQWITGISDYDLYLEQSLSPAALEQTFGSPGDQPLLSIYDYGVGDHWEAQITRP
jgi:hypothetical protein